MRISDWSSDVCSSDLSLGSCGTRSGLSRSWGGRQAVHGQVESGEKSLGQIHEWVAEPSGNCTEEQVLEAPGDLRCRLPRLHLARLLAGLNHTGQHPSALAVGGFVPVRLVAIWSVTGKVPEGVIQISLSLSCATGIVREAITLSCIEG